jgi:hypothetical protein
MGSPHLEKIKQLIAKSLILQDHEREEWLLMAETMNDKQLSDLESILAQDKPASQPAAPVSRPPVVQPMPHLQNAPRPVMPTAQPGQRPPVAAAPAKPAMAQPLLVLNARRVAPPQGASVAPLAQAPSAAKPVMPFPVTPPPVQVPKPSVTPPRPTPGIHHPEPAVVHQVPASHADHSTKAVLDDLKTITLKKPELIGIETSVSISSVKTLSDASRINLKSMRQLGHDAIIQGLHQLLSNYSYHDVVFALEQSPVYQLFLLTGSKLLTTGNPVTLLPETSSESVLSQEEFTFLTELPWQLRKKS